MIRVDVMLCPTCKIEMCLSQDEHYWLCPACPARMIPRERPVTKYSRMYLDARRKWFEDLPRAIRGHIVRGRSVYAIERENGMWQIVRPLKYPDRESVSFYDRVAVIPPQLRAFVFRRAK